MIAGWGFRRPRRGRPPPRSRPRGRRTHAIGDRRASSRGSTRMVRRTEAGPVVYVASVPASSRLCDRSGAHAGARNRRHDSDFQRRARGRPAPVPVPINRIVSFWSTPMSWQSEQRVGRELQLLRNQVTTLDHLAAAFTAASTCQTRARPSESGDASRWTNFTVFGVPPLLAGSSRTRISQARRSGRVDVTVLGATLQCRSIDRRAGRSD